MYLAQRVLIKSFDTYKVVLYLGFTANVNMMSPTLDACPNCLLAPVPVGSDTVDKHFAHFGHAHHGLRVINVSNNYFHIVQCYS